MIAAWCEHHHMKPVQHSHDILSGRWRGGARGPLAPLFWNQTKAWRARKIETAPPLPLSEILDLPLILCFAFQLNVLCLIVPCFRQVFCLCFFTSCCSSRRNDSSQLVTPAYLMISECAWSRAVKKRAQSWTPTKPHFLGYPAWFYCSKNELITSGAINFVSVRSS